MVSIERTTRKYRGKTASGYDAKRRIQRRWELENEHVAALMRGATGSVLDAPCGTGRFLPLWRELGLIAEGVDVSAEMLTQAAAKMGARSGTSETILNMEAEISVGLKLLLRIGSLDDYSLNQGRKFDSVVCVRFLDLIDEDAMRRVVTRLCAVARKRIVITIRLGDEYVAKTNTATHDVRKFRALLTRLGWKADEERPVFRAGWRVMRLIPREKRRE